MYETLLRPHEVTQVPALEPVTRIAERLKRAEVRREEKRLRQIANNALLTSNKRKRDAGEAEEEDMVDGDVSKRIKVEVDEVEDDIAISQEPESIPVPIQEEEERPVAEKMDSSRVLTEVRGHTSYLTFACLVPFASIAGQESTSTSEEDVS